MNLIRYISCNFPCLRLYKLSSKALNISAFFYAFIFSVRLTHAQNIYDYKPLRYTRIVPENVAGALTTQAQDEFTPNPISDDKKINNEYSELTRFRSRYLISEFEKGNFITSGPLYDYLNVILDSLLVNNSSLAEKTKGDNSKSRAHIFPYRSTAPNAFNSNNIIGINLGLLAKVKKEDQLAFVICHELVHSTRSHSELKTRKLAIKLHSSGFQKKIKKAKKSQYNRVSKQITLFSQLELDVNKHSQNKEFEADSLGALLFLNSSYNPNEVLRTIELLKTIDEPDSVSTIDLESIFDSPDYAFKKEWIKYERGMTWDIAKEVVPDSIKTHPNCDARIESLKEVVQDEIRSNTSLSNRFVDEAKFEIINTMFQNEKFGKALYQSLILRNKYPENPFLKNTIANCFFAIYHAQKDHELSRVLDPKSGRNPIHYDKFLNFIHKLRLSEIARIGFHYIEQVIQRQAKEDKESWLAYYRLSTIINDVDTSENIKSTFQKKFASSPTTLLNINRN